MNDKTEEIKDLGKLKKELIEEIIESKPLFSDETAFLKENFEEHKSNILINIKKLFINACDLNQDTAQNKSQFSKQKVTTLVDVK